MQPFRSGSAKHPRQTERGLAPGESQPKEAREDFYSQSPQPEEPPPTRSRPPSTQDIDLFEQRLREELERAEADGEFASAIADADL